MSKLSMINYKNDIIDAKAKYTSHDCEIPKDSKKKQHILDFISSFVYFYTYVHKNTMYLETSFPLRASVVQLELT